MKLLVPPLTFEGDVDRLGQAIVRDMLQPLVATLAQEAGDRDAGIMLAGLVGALSGTCIALLGTDAAERIFAGAYSVILDPRTLTEPQQRTH